MGVVAEVGRCWLRLWVSLGNGGCYFSGADVLVFWGKVVVSDWGCGELPGVRVQVAGLKRFLSWWSDGEEDC